MFTRGEYRDSSGTYGVVMNYTRGFVEVILISAGEVCSAYRKGALDEYSFLSNKAKNFYKYIHSGVGSCSSKNGTSLQFSLGTSVFHQFIKAKIEYAVEMFNSEVVGFEAKGDELFIRLSWLENGEGAIPHEIPYIKLVRTDLNQADQADPDNIIVRSVQEIALDKEDVSWLSKKKYFIVNDDTQAEQLFSYLDNYNGVIAYDTETTGLKINCFGKINSVYQANLKDYNAKHPDDQIRADKLVGIIFCIEPDTSYYFPCLNRKFKNLYESDTDTRRQVVERIKSRYVLGELRDKQGEMAQFIRDTPSNELTSDVILMERVRNILETKHIVTHGGSFEWKVGWQYEIDTNIKDDTMILHQIMYKFRSTTSNRGEPSNLKYLSKHELGIDQWELKDFFPDYKEASGEVKSKKAKKSSKSSKSSKAKIDFSYMDYAGTRVYAPTDGDCTLQLFYKYKKDLITNHKEQEYLYNVEVIVACAVGYMEFYGLRIDEEKISAVRDQTLAKTALIESEIRQYMKYSSPEEIQAYQRLKASVDRFNQLEKDKNTSLSEREKENENTLKIVEELKDAIKANTEYPLNLGSPAQVSELFYDKLNIPFSGEKKSVAAKEIKSLLKAKNEDGSIKYPIVHLYADYKKLDTLMTKFFDNLPYFMYPGGLIFPSYGQISTATGRMSCNKPNAQQFPKDITKIVIPREDYVMLDADYSQIEYRVLVALSGEERLAELFSDPDSDYHTLMASLMYSVPYESVTPKMRSDAKSFNFGIPYGMGLGSLAILLTGINTPTTREEAGKKYELYFKDQPKVRKFFEQVKEMAQVNKFTRTFWNRYRYYSFTDADGNENRAKKASAMRQAGNSTIQGCLHGDTLIQTQEFGIVKIKDIVDNSLYVWDGDKWSWGDVLYSGKKRKCIVTFGNGQQFICSPTHKFLVRSAKGNERFVECQNLRGRSVSKNPHRVVINREYVSSGHTIDKVGLEGSLNQHRIPKEVLGDTELLREYLRGLFGDTFTFVYDTENLCRDIQKALLFLGIRSSYDANRLTILSDDTEKFLDFLKSNMKNNSTTQTLSVESVEITDEYIDMYDVCNTDGGYYVADGIITHNTAADIFKISVARNFMYIRQNGLLGLLLIVNMIHDEQLMEVNYKALNIQRVLRDVGKNMQFKIEGFPPLYIGAGIGPAWGMAKGKMAEIHPNLLEELSIEAENMPLRLGTAPTPTSTSTSTSTPTNSQHPMTNTEILDYFAGRVLDFRKRQVREYITNPDNFGTDLHPTIGNLLNLQFSYGHDKEKEGLSDSDFTKLCLSEFIRHENIPNISPDNFIPQKEQVQDMDEDEEYTDGDEEELDEYTSFIDADYMLVDEDSTVFGASVTDLIRVFGTFVSKVKHICGINLVGMSVRKREEIVEFLTKHVCDPSTPDAMEVVFLQDANILSRTGIYVNNIDGSEVEARIKASNIA